MMFHDYACSKFQRDLELKGVSDHKQHNTPSCDVGKVGDHAQVGPVSKANRVNEHTVIGFQKHAQHVREFEREHAKGHKQKNVP